MSDRLVEVLPAKNLKQSDLMKCVLCKRGVMHDGGLVFVRIAVTHYVVNLPAIRRQHVLETMMGHPGLARAFSQDEDMAMAVDSEVVVNVCIECTIGFTVGSLLNAIEEALDDSRDKRRES